MNQIQNWFINSRKRFLGPLKSDIEKDDISGNIDTSVHQSLPVKPTHPFSGFSPNNPLLMPQNIIPPVFPLPVQYDQKDPTIALNIPDQSQKNQSGNIDLNKVNHMILQMNQLQAMWVQSNPIFSYYNQIMMQQMNPNGMVVNDMSQFQRQISSFDQRQGNDNNGDFNYIGGDNYGNNLKITQNER